MRIMPEIGFGSVWDKKNKRKVYFSTVTEFTNTSYEKLNEGLYNLLPISQEGHF